MRESSIHRDSEHALRAETAFLNGVEANLETAKGKLLRGKNWTLVRDNESESLRASMADRRLFDRDILKKLPHNKRIILEGSEPRWFFFTRKTGVAVASVMSRWNHLLEPGSHHAEPVTLTELTETVHKLVRDKKTPHVVGICSTSGFTPEALDNPPDLPNCTLVMVEPREGGGWEIHGGSSKVPPAVVQLFDPEGSDQKIERVREDIEEHSVELLTGGLSSEAISERTGLSEPLVNKALEKIAADEPELRITKKKDEVLLYRGAASRSREGVSMSNMVDKIRQLFSGEGDEAKKINELSERRAQLAQRRDRIYEDIGKLEERERSLLKEGRDSESKIARRRLAAQLAQLRKDISRQNTTANMLNQQINILSTDIHNLTLLQQGQMAQLPDTEKLTENAVAAEEMLETLRADSELVSSLETGMSETSMTDEEQAILAEFEEPSSAASSTTPEMTPEEREAMNDFSPPEPPEKEKPKAEPEGN